MNYKKKTIILSIFLIISIQTLLLLNNRQKTSFRYFIWNIEEVSIGRLICISFISGVIISTVLNKTLNKKVKRTFKKEENVKKEPDDDNSINREFEDESYEIPPERDIRDTQPTISVNYRVIKDNSDNQLKDKNESSYKYHSEDDWNNNDSEW